jgi:hypothetical protein
MPSVYWILLFLNFVGQTIAFGFHITSTPGQVFGSGRRTISCFAAVKDGHSLRHTNDDNEDHHTHDHGHHHHDLMEEDNALLSNTSLGDAPSLAHDKHKFYQLLQDVMTVKDPQHLPSLLTKNVDLILALSGQDGAAVIQSILNDARQAPQGDMDNEDDNNNSGTVAQLEDAIELTLSFAEDFVQSAQVLDDQNKKVLGKIIHAMSNKELVPLQREEALDAIFIQERPNFSAGFLRHLEGECQAIEKSLSLSSLSSPAAPDAQRTLEMLRVIHTRVLEEVGQDLGEEAQVLQQLIGYDNDEERMVVLEAGLMVRGNEFAQDLQDLTTEALEGLQRVPGKGAEPELIRIVQSIHEGIQSYLEKNSSTSFQ